MSDKKLNAWESISVLEVGRAILDEFKEEIGEEEYNRIINGPIKGCSCGYIKEGDDTPCHKCEFKNE